MIVQSDIKPANEFDIFQDGDEAVVTFYIDVIEKHQEDRDYYEWEEYSIRIIYTENLKEIISDSIDSWIQLAKQENS